MRSVRVCVGTATGAVCHPRAAAGRAQEDVSGGGHADGATRLLVLCNVEAGRDSDGTHPFDVCMTIVFTFLMWVPALSCMSSSSNVCTVGWMCGRLSPLRKACVRQDCYAGG